MNRNVPIQFNISYSKRKIFWSIWKILLLFLFVTGSHFSQTVKEYKPTYSNPLEESLRWQSYPELIGLGCRSMVEDNNGTLWFGVAGGVVSYDGLE